MANGRKNKRAADGRINTLAQTGYYILVTTHTHTDTKGLFLLGMEPCNKLSTLIQTTPECFFSFANVFPRRKDRSCFFGASLFVCPPVRARLIALNLAPIFNDSIKKWNEHLLLFICESQAAPARTSVRRIELLSEGTGQGIHPWCIYLQAALFITCKCIYRSAPLPPSLLTVDGCGSYYRHFQAMANNGLTQWRRMARRSIVFPPPKK